ncbi:MAG: hypothetical protein WAK01_06265, partial [Methylocystis sp.]
IKLKVYLSQERGDLHTSGKFLCINSLDVPSIISFIDDDIVYPHDYISTLVKHLGALSSEAIIGVHGRKFKPPYASYVDDVESYHFAQALMSNTEVDELGTGACAFLSNPMKFDVRKWVYTDACDIQLALEAQKRGIRRVCIKRPRGWLSPLAEDQPESCWTKTKADPSRQNSLMRSLISSDAPLKAARHGSTLEQSL